MKTGFFILLIFLTTKPILLHSQSGSVLYNSQGCLKSDTTKCIEKSAIKKWFENEDFILWQISNRFKYPVVAQFDELNGYALIQIEVWENGEIEFETIQNVGGGLEEKVISSLSSSSSRISKLLRPEKDGPLTYFVPIDFKLDNLKTIADSSGRLMLGDSHYPKSQF